MILTPLPPSEWRFHIIFFKHFHCLNNIMSGSFMETDRQFLSLDRTQQVNAMASQSRVDPEYLVHDLRPVIMSLLLLLLCKVGTLRLLLLPVFRWHHSLGLGLKTQMSWHSIKFRVSVHFTTTFKNILFQFLI